MSELSATQKRWARAEVKRCEEVLAKRRIAERGALDNGQNLGLRSTNTSGFRGVAWHKPTRKWLAKVTLNGKQHNLGSFETPEQADAVCKAFRAEHMPFSDDARAA